MIIIKVKLVIAILIMILIVIIIIIAIIMITIIIIIIIIIITIIIIACAHLFSNFHLPFYLLFLLLLVTGHCLNICEHTISQKQQLKNMFCS